MRPVIKGAFLGFQENPVLRIAVIDDEPLICEVVDAYLSDNGAEVHSATTARLGAAMLTEGQFDLALIDVLLPDASGFALAEVAANENTAVLLMTGHPDAAMRMGALNIPCLMKPFNSFDITTAVEREIAKSHQNIERIKSGIARLDENIEGMSEPMAFSKTLIEKGRQILAKADAQKG
jgi:two-component system OmpR family response regulator